MNTLCSLEIVWRLHLEKHVHRLRVRAENVQAVPHAVLMLAALPRHCRRRACGVAYTKYVLIRVQGPTGLWAHLGGVDRTSPARCRQSPYNAGAVVMMYVVLLQYVRRGELSLSSTEAGCVPIADGLKETNCFVLGCWGGVLVSGLWCGPIFSGRGCRWSV